MDCLTDARDTPRSLVAPSGAGHWARVSTRGIACGGVHLLRENSCPFEFAAGIRAPPRLRRALHHMVTGPARPRNATRPGYDGIVERPSRLLILAVAFCVAIAGTLIFGFRVGRHARRMHFENEPIRPWMSVPFIAHTHHVPSALLFHAIGLEPEQHDRRPLRLIARQEHRPVEDMMRDLERALAGAGHTHSAPETPRGKAP